MQSVAVSGSVCRRSQIFRLCANEVAYCCHQLLAAYTCHIIGGLDAFRFISLRCRSAGIFCRDFTVLRVVLRCGLCFRLGSLHGHNLCAFLCGGFGCGLRRPAYPSGIHFLLSGLPPPRGGRPADPAAQPAARRRQADGLRPRSRPVSAMPAARPPCLPHPHAPLRAALCLFLLALLQLQACAGGNPRQAARALGAS